MCMRPANERRRYNVTSSLIGWTHSQGDPCISIAFRRMAQDPVNIGSGNGLVLSGTKPLLEPMFAKIHDMVSLGHSELNVEPYIYVIKT